MSDIFTVVICILLGITLIMNIILLVFKIFLPEKKEDVKGVPVKGHYTTTCIGPCVCRIWHSDE